MVAFAGPRPRVAVALTSHGLYGDQAEAASGAFPGSHLTFAIGSDKLVQLAEPGWYEDRDAALGRLFSRAEVRYAMRAGEREHVRDALRSLDRWAEGIRPLHVPRAVEGISSTAVRRAIREGSDVRGVVPPEVLPYLAS